MSRAERVLVLAPQGRDAAIAARLLAEARRSCLVCTDLDDLRLRIEEGAAAAILAEEAVRTADLRGLAELVAKQPSWSDFPFVLLTRKGGGERNASLTRVTGVLGNATLLERPFHPATLVSVVDTALRARRRQYAARAHLLALRESEDRLSTALKAGRLGAWELLIGPGALVASEECKANFGRTPGDVFTYEDLIASIAAEDRAAVRAAMAHSLATAEDFARDFRVRWPDGSLHWVDVRGQVLTGDSRKGSALRVVGVSTDITERKQAEAERERLMRALAAERTRTQDALKGEKAFTGLMLTSVPAGIVAYDGDLRVTTWNPVMQRLFGLGTAEVTGRPLLDILARVQGSAVASRMRDALAGRAGPVEELELASEAGGQKWVCETQHAPLAGGDGRIVGGVAFFRDTTERRRAEEQLRQAQKMETIGQLTGGVAHDFNNLLMAVLGNLNLLRKKMPPDPQLQRYVDGAAQGAQRGAALTQRLLAFARRQDLKPEAVGLPQLIDGMKGLMERSLGPQVVIDVDASIGLPPARVDANQLELAILNLAVNARDAMPEGGRLRISVEEAKAPAELGLGADTFLRLAVADSGAGMDAATLKSAIEPFFSTKELGKGTGLGLSMVHGLAVQSGGALRLKSAPGKGTVAELWLPIASAPVAPARPARTSNGETPPARILVVDDDALIAMSTVDMLEDLGHTVIEANSGRAALDILESPAQIDAMVTDHAMPGMTGVELATRARRLRPGLPILLATGYADLPAGTGTDLPRLGKPYEQHDLEEQLAKLLGGARQ